MTISTTTNRVTYTGNGVTVAFSFPYAFFAQADLVVVETIIATGVQTTKTITTYYTISGSVDALGHYSSGGTVTAVTAPASTVTWTIYRDPAATQTTDIVENDPMPAESIEAALDYQTMLNQRTRDIAARSLQQPEGDSATIGRLPAKVDRASAYLGFDGDGDPTALSAPTSTALTTAYSETLLDDATAAAARTTLGFPTVSGATTGHALVVDPAASGGMSWSHRAQPNPIINGNMEIWQRGAAFAAAATGTYTADRWKWVQTGAGVVTLNRSTSVPTVAQAGVLFNYSLEVDVTTVDAAIAAGDFYYLAHPIEGANWRHFAQRDLVLSFWVLATKTGAHAVALNNAGRNRAAVANYTVIATNTWEYKTVSFGASPSAGTWDYTTGEGAVLSFALAAGSDSYNTGGSGAWETSTAWHGAYGAGPVNDLDSTANYFRLTGVKLELGSIATPIQYVPFEEELARCQRYYQKSFNYATAPAQNAGTDGAETVRAPYTGTTGTGRNVPFKTRMRTTPGTVTLYNPSAANAQVRNATDAADDGSSAAVASENGLFVGFTPNAANTAGDDHLFHWTAAAEL